MLTAQPSARSLRPPRFLLSVEERARWCGPCRMVSPALGQLARDLAGQVNLVAATTDTSLQISQRFGVQAILVLLVLRG